jgi:hypothetical protein
MFSRPIMGKSLRLILFAWALYGPDSITMVGLFDTLEACRSVAPDRGRCVEVEQQWKVYLLREGRWRPYPTQRGWGWYRTEQECKSELVKHPYDLQHGKAECRSDWRSTGRDLGIRQ